MNVSSQTTARSSRRTLAAALALSAVLAGGLLAGCASGQQEKSAEAPQQSEQQEPAAATEQVTYPFRAVIDRANLDPAYTGALECVATKHLESQGIENICIASDGTAKVEAPEGTWDELKAYVFEFVSAQAAQEATYTSSDEAGNAQEAAAAPLSCEIGDDFATLSIGADFARDAFGMAQGASSVVTQAVGCAAEYRTFAGLDSTIHLTIADETGAVLFDQDVDVSNSDYFTQLEPLFYPAA